MIRQLIGIDIGGTTIKFGLLDLYGNIYKKWAIKTNLEDSGRMIPTEIVDNITNEILLKVNGEINIIGIGVGVPGPISSDGSIVIRAVNLGWSNLPLKNILEKELAIPVSLVNDANAAALGELWQGTAKGKDNLLFVTLGTGIGGGLIINGKLLNGVHSSAGEIGHIPVESTRKRTCRCGNINCLETYSSATGLQQTMIELNIEENSYQNLSTSDIFQLAKNGDTNAKKAINITVNFLGKAIAGILNTIDVEQIVIGGGLSNAGDALLIPLHEVIDQHTFPQIRNEYLLRQAKLGNDAGVYGAAYSVI